MSEVNSMGDRADWSDGYHAALAEKLKREEEQRRKAEIEAVDALREPLLKAGVVQLGLE